MCGKLWNLGYYVDEREAAQAYDEAMVVLLDYHKLNFPMRKALTRLENGRTRIKNRRILREYPF